MQSVVCFCGWLLGAIAFGWNPPVSPAIPTVPQSVPRLIVPVQGVRPQELTDTYNDARGEGRVHDAIDIAALKGTPVLAATDASVLKLFQSERGGTTLYLLASDKRTILYYAHLERYADGLTEGQPVRRGQVVAYVGDTGNAGPNNYHLHFEVTQNDNPKRFWDGTPVNPYPLLTGKPGKSAVVPVVAAQRPAKRSAPLVKSTAKSRIRPHAKVVITRPKPKPVRVLSRGKIVGSSTYKTRRPVMPNPASSRRTPATAQPKGKTLQRKLPRKRANVPRPVRKGTMKQKTKSEQTVQQRLHRGV